MGPKMVFMPVLDSCLHHHLQDLGVRIKPDTPRKPLIPLCLLTGNRNQPDEEVERWADLHSGVEGGSSGA